MQTIEEYIEEKRNDKIINQIIDLKLIIPQTPSIKNKIQKLQQQL